MCVFRKQIVAIIGANGQVGQPLARNLLELGHQLILLVPDSNMGALVKLEARGAMIRTIGDMADSAAVAEAIEGAETLSARCLVRGGDHPPGTGLAGGGNQGWCATLCAQRVWRPHARAGSRGGGSV